ncbi:carbonic anhydrase [Enterobacteriaceae bacterium LUAb1]
MMEKRIFFVLLLAIIGTAQAGNIPIWTYEGKAGPEHWGELSPAFSVCHTGQFQSPIDIRSPVDAKLPALDIIFHSAAESMVNNGHTIQITVSDEDDFKLDNHHFTLMQYHFHSPSENLINGKQYPLEAHFVHTSANGDLAVVAVMFKTGKENSALKPILNSLPAETNKVVPVNQRFNLKPLFPHNQHYYRFSGSLTTPPCTEGVRWLVMSHPVTLSKEQLAIFQKALKNSNNRPIQPLHGRLIVK